MADTKTKKAVKTEKAEPATTKTEDSKKKQPMATWKKVLIGIGVAFIGFIVAMVLMVNVLTGDAAEASDEFLNYIQASDGASAYQLFSTDAKSQVPEDEFIVVVNQIGPILNTEERKTGKSIEGSSDSASTATISYEIDGTDGVTYEFDNNMIKEGDEWKVLNFDSREKQ